MDHLLFDLNPSPVLIYQPDTLRILEVNNAFCRKYGYTEDEIREMTIRDIRPAEDLDILEEALDDLQDEGISKSGMVRHKAKDGELFFVNVNSHAYSYKGEKVRVVVIHDVTERVEAEQRAQEAFDELNHHVTHSPLALIKWDSDFCITQWSQRAYEITGYSEEEVKGEAPHLFNIYGDDREIVEQHMGYLISGEKDKTNFELKMYRKDGSLADLRVHASVLRDDEDSLVSVLTFVEDITQQKKTELRYQRLFENANDGIFIMQDGKFIECNDQVLNIYGCSSRDEILGKTPADFSPEYQPDGQRSDEKAGKKISKALADEPQVFEWKHLRQDGTEIDVEVSLNRMELIGDVYIQAIVRDLTEQKKAQEQLRRSEKLFRKLFLKAPGAMVMVDNDNKVLMVNHSFEELFGYTQEELKGRDIDEVIVGDDQEQTPRMPGDEFKDGRFYEDVVRYGKDGDKRTLLLGAIPVYLDGEPIAGFGIYIDITEQKENEEKLKKSLDEKRVLLEEIHHRVKNNLAIVSGLLQMQVLSVNNDRLTNYLQNSQLRIQSMAIVHEMLYQSETLSEIKMDTYIEKLVTEISDTLAPEHKQIDLNVACDEFVLNINQAIPCALCINEMITNCYDFAFEGRSEGQIEVIVNQDDDLIDLTVRDDGVGLPENFEEMRRTSLGMSLIENLTRQLETEVDIDSGEWGTSFQFAFRKTDKPGSSSSGRVG